MESESVYDGLFQMQHNERSQFSPTCLRIPHILRKILEHCSNSELLPLSLVNKQWNNEAWSVLKHGGTLDAHLHPHQPCKDLAAFASHLRQMNVVPYAGISIYFLHHPKESWSAEVLNSIDVIQNQLPLKNLTVLFRGYRYVNRECPAFLLVKKILLYHCEKLESLQVGGPYDSEAFIRHAVPHSTFPRLKTLKLGRLPGRLEESQTALITTMVSRAPKLQELHLYPPVDAPTDLLKGSSAVLELVGEIDPVNHEIHDDLIGALRLRRMRLEYKDDGDFSMERFNRIVPVVLQTSRTALLELRLESAFAPSLMRYGIRLENVTKLTINLSNRELEVLLGVAADVSAFFTILQNFDFTQIFPKLNEVKVTHSLLRLLPREILQFVASVKKTSSCKTLIPVEPSISDTSGSNTHPLMSQFLLQCFLTLKNFQLRTGTGQLHPLD